MESGSLFLYDAGCFADGQANHRTPCSPTWRGALDSISLASRST